ncbi:DNA/RNA non-specific endonuclease [Litoribacter ruber]|uniref:DNA/RNA non-specific endonuclease n=1 Tax=Litoribacter ruber TaxID=702568 RepID=UPI001BDB61E4|nr:DNA/RNA non-specific endonuclease [Litoribacter ruber]MBT0810175.1 DNA/RNA non-specific endonuclease [Litoribacter ruber]
MAKTKRSKRKPQKGNKYSFLIFFLLVLAIFSLSIYTMQLVKDIEGPSIKSPEARKELAQQKAAVKDSPTKEKVIPAGQTETVMDFDEFLLDLVSSPEFSHPTLSVNQEGELISHSAYSLAYDEENEQAYWVSYKLTADMLNGGVKRGNNFREDPTVSTASASPLDYRLSGYDRGHLAPAGDFTYSKSAMDESFYMSNMSPQTPAFNRGIWKKLEEQVRYWAKANEEIFVVTGPVIKEKSLTLGQNKVTVPEYFYKVILDIHPPEYKAIAFLMKNEKSNRPLLDFAISVDSLERFAGLDFFPMLPDTLEKRLEKSKNHEIWFE